MLNRIFIQNFALIDTLEIDLHRGMQVITGETGAGKSIILGALRLILGERADIKSIAQSEKKSIVEVEFSLSSRFRLLFEELDIDFEEETIIRREILPNGKSRAFINDVPTTLDSLRKITEKLIDIHSQFETGNLFTEEYQLGILDGIAGNGEVLREYQALFQEYQFQKRKLSKLENQLQEDNQQNDYKKFLWEELEEAGLDTLQWEEVQVKLAMQENAELITEQLTWVLERFNAEEMGIMEGLRNAQNKLQKAHDASPMYGELLERLSGVFIELKDWVQDLQTEAEKIDIDTQQKLHLQNQVNTIQKLFLKHQTDSIDALIGIRDGLHQEQSGVENIEESIKELRQKIQESEAMLSQKARLLSEARKKAALLFKEKTEATLSQLGLDKAKIEAELQPSEVFLPLGKEQMSILFQANTGFPMKPIQNAISGGERSRVMLAIKKIMAENNELPTLILDEIDTGVSGKVAEEIGKVMRDMARDLQLIVITHLAQVAAKGEHHYKVLKREVDGVTQSTILSLSEAEKLQEIAQLLSGASITPAALEQAKALME